MKYYNLFLIILISFFSKAYCQNKVKLDRDYFVIGTLNDYMGRKKAFHDKETVEESKYTRVVMKYNFNLLKDDYNDLVIDSTKKNKSDYVDNLNIVLKSKKFASKITPLYSYRDDLEIIINENSEIIDSVYTGILKPNIFKNKLQRLSFITGVYCTNGVTNESKYSIQFVNSIGKYSVCEEVLKKLGCKNVELIVTEAIPWTETIYFEPTEKLKIYLDEFEYLRNKVKKENEAISNKFNAYYKSIQVK
jgi:hypothetical protein